MLVHLALTVLATTAHAQKNPGTMNISYGSASWNTDSTTIDSAYMVLKDKTTGKTVQVQLEETEPDSSKFDGRFNVNLGQGALKPQVYVPPKNLRNPERDYKKVAELINAGKLKSQPLITKTNDKGEQVLDVYDTDEQAAAAQKAYAEEERLREEAAKQKLIKTVPDEKKVQAAAAAEGQALVAKMALEAAKRESDRIRLEQIERQKSLEREKAAKAISEKERSERQAKAKALVEEAMVFFNQGKFIEVEDRFRQSVELDPDNHTTYLRYGISLYKNQKFNEALVILKLSEVEKDLEHEKAYFMGLTHYRLKELDSAEEQFKAAAKSTDKIIGPSSLFYLGVVQFTKGQLEAAKGNFETVIDTSSNPRMDAEAENYIERIAQAMIFKKLQEKPWTLTGTVGLQYDSNVLLSPDNTGSQGSSTKEGDVRAATVGGVYYRAIYEEKHELTAKFDANLTNSAKSSVSRADPFLFDFSLPYSHKGVWLGKGHVLTVKPTYELLYMDPNATGTKEKILGSTILTIDNTFVMNPVWFATYSFEARQDDFDLTGSTGDDNYDAMKYTVKTAQTFYRDKTRKEALTANLGYILNSASGKNKRFTRYDIGATYSRPMKWGYSWNVGLSTYVLDYFKSTDKRNDVNVVFTTGIDKPIREWVTWSVSGSYTQNDSTEETSYEYSRWLILTSATFTGNF